MHVRGLVNDTRTAQFVSASCKGSTQTHCEDLQVQPGLWQKASRINGSVNKMSGAKK